TLLRNSAGGSNIIVATRSERVARGLSKGQSWSLFILMAFEQGVEPRGSRLVEIGKDIVEKCVGIPLAIRTVGRLLYCNKIEAYWLPFRQEELSKIKQEGNHILPILELSYNHIPSHLHQCFSYCVLFQDVIYDGDGNIVKCKIHDLVHDLAGSVSRTEWIEIVPSSISKLKHLWYLNLPGNGITKLPNSVSKLLNLETPDCNGCRSLAELPRILEGCRGAELSQLNGLNNLGRHLSIKNSGNKQNAAGLANLETKEYLESLTFQLSRSLSSLSDITEICIRNCRRCQYIPPLEQLPSLKSLTLSWLDALVYICFSSIASRTRFSSLEYISILGFPELKGWLRRIDNDADGSKIDMIEPPSFPCLSELDISGCPKLILIPLYPYLETDWRIPV
ncbi:hypothetical protein CICLE_v10024488mg, partial [Citrus x clementina]